MHATPPPGAEPSPARVVRCLFVNKAVLACYEFKRKDCTGVLIMHSNKVPPLGVYIPEVPSVQRTREGRSLLVGCCLNPPLTTCLVR